MPTVTVEIPTPDGVATGTLHTPRGSGPWPGVVLFPDAGGARDAFVAMADRLGGDGLAVLVPDVYYRTGGYEPFRMETAFTDEGERNRLFGLVASLTPERIATDVVADADALAARPEVADGPIGTTGYCMGGRISLTAAGVLGERVGAAASFHGGRLAVEDDPASPHHRAAEVRARVYVGAARDDGTFDAAQAAGLAAAYEAAGVDHTIETYDALHGFAVPDNPTFDEAASERHMEAMASLFATLR